VTVPEGVEADVDRGPDPLGVQVLAVGVLSLGFELAGDLVVFFLLVVPLQGDESSMAGAGLVRLGLDFHRLAVESAERVGKRSTVDDGDARGFKLVDNGLLLRPLVSLITGTLQGVVVAAITGSLHQHLDDLGIILEFGDGRRQVEGEEVVAFGCCGGELRAADFQDSVDLGPLGTGPLGDLSGECPSSASCSKAVTRSRVPSPARWSFSPS